MSLFALLWILHQLSNSTLPLNRDGMFWLSALVISLNLNFLSWDLPEIGVNTFLVALSWFAIYLWARQRVLGAAISLGAAAALKCTPLLFVAYFALKREWRMVVASTAAC